MENSYFLALSGGVLIGFAAALLLWTNGKILGVSGILGGALEARSWNLSWRLSFLSGLILGSFLIGPMGFTIMELNVKRSLPLVAFGGLLVGLGTTIGSGCTSGHGVCGVSRFSKRSLFATLVFMISGVFSVAIVKLFFEGL